MEATHAAGSTAAAATGLPFSMPTLFRLFAILLVIAAMGAGAMVYLGTFVSPHTRQMTVTIPPAKFAQQ